MKSAKCRGGCRRGGRTRAGAAAGLPPAGLGEPRGCERLARQDLSLWLPLQVLGCFGGGPSALRVAALADPEPCRSRCCDVTLGVGIQPLVVLRGERDSSEGGFGEVSYVLKQTKAVASKALVTPVLLWGEEGGGIPLKRTLYLAFGSAVREGIAWSVKPRLPVESTPTVRRALFSTSAR